MRPSSHSKIEKVVVIGAGITGLVCARELIKNAQKSSRSVRVTLLESSPRIGGKIRSETLDDALIETGPDSFVTLKPEMIELINELGLRDELIGTAADATVSVLKDGRLLPMPSGMQLITPTRLLPFIFSPLFSLRGKLRLLMEPFILPRRSGEDESLADFARRRLGREAFEVLVAPMLAGIFAGDPEKLSVKSTFPQLLEMEKTGGVARSLWVRRRARSPRPKGISTFMTLKSGLSRVTEEIAKSLPPGTVHTDCPVGALRRHGGHWEVVTPKGVFEADTVIAALPSPALADAVDGMDPELGMRLREIPFASTATVTMIYDAATFPKPPRGFGFLSALGESMTLTAATFASSKFPQRCPKDKVVIRCFVGGAGREESAEGAVMRIQSRVREDLERVLGVKGVSPRAVKTTRWLSANPQYNIGHSRRLDRLTSCLKSYPGLILAGSSYHGVGLPDCVKSGRRAAQMAFAHHSGRRHEFSESGLA